MRLLALVLVLVFGAPPPDVTTLVAFSLRLMPLAPGAGDGVMLHRMAIAGACVEATTDRAERYLCMKIPRYEALYREDVAACEVRGRAGEVTSWQILPRTAAERGRLCRSFTGDARVAIERIRESRAACRSLPIPEQLALYARGDCASAEGRKLSRVRWAYEGEIRGLE